MLLPPSWLKCVGIYRLAAGRELKGSEGETRARGGGINRVQSGKSYLFMNTARFRPKRERGTLTETFIVHNSILQMEATC
jgi:hypothetical protein